MTREDDLSFEPLTPHVGVRDPSDSVGASDDALGGVSPVPSGDGAASADASEPGAVGATPDPADPANVPPGFLESSEDDLAELPKAGDETWPALPIVRDEDLHDTRGSGDGERPDPPLPDIIGRYTIVSEIGRGGVGVVYKAFDPVLKRHVALKMVLDAGWQEEAERFDQEARLCAKLRHPGIVGVHEAGRHQGKIFFVMDYVEGENLETILDKEPMRQRRMAAIVRDVALALDYAHGHGVIHRDVKPPNVLIDAMGVVQLADFGTARDTGATNLITQTGEVVGTPSYMAPEQAIGGDSDAKPTIDVWALGALLYRGLAGRPAFEGTSAVGVLHKVINEDPEPLRRIDSTVNADLEAIVFRCLEKEPARRYQTAAAVAAEIDRFLRGEPIEARGIGSGERLARWARRNRALATSIGLSVAFALVVLVAGVIFAAYSFAQINAALLTAREGRAEAERAEALARQATERALAEADRAERERVTAEASLAGALRERAGRLVTEGRAQEAWVTLARALQLVEDPETRALLEQARAVSPRLRLLLTRGEAGEARQVALGLDGRLLAIAGKGGVLRLWDLGTGRPFGAPLSVGGESLALGWCESVVSVVTHTGAVAQWMVDVDSGQLVAMPGAPSQGGSFDGAALDPQGRVYALARGATVELREIPGGASRGVIHGHSEDIESITFGPRGDLLASAGGDAWARVWSTTRGRLSQKLFGHRGPVRQVAISSDARLIATASDDGTVRLWETMTGKELVRRATPRSRSVVALAFEPDGRLVAVAGDDGSLELWRTASAERVLHIVGFRRPVESMLVGRDGALVVAIGDDGAVRVWQRPAEPADDGGAELSVDALVEEAMAATGLAVDGLQVVPVAFEKGFFAAR